MRKIILCIICSIAYIFAVSQNIFPHTADKSFEVSYWKTGPKSHRIRFDINIDTNSDIATIQVNENFYSKIIFESSVFTGRRGWAELPIISTSIQLPATGNVDLEVADAAYIDYQPDFPPLPSRGVIYRNQNPEELPYTIAEDSYVNRFYPEEWIEMEDPYIIRDVRGTTIRVCPVRYNTTTNTLRIYTTIVVDLTENNFPGINPLLHENPVPVQEAIGMYQSMFINYESPYTPLSTAETGDILVLTPSTYANEIEPFIQWKREMGYHVTKQIVNSGTNVANTIHTAYLNNHNLMYVQLVGDWADIKSNTINDDGEECPTDPAMGCVAGDDDYPDIAIGRFSCSNAAQLATQINKAINYEKNPNMDAGWRETFIGIGSAEGSSSGDDNESDSIHIQRIYSERLQDFTYETHRKNYGDFANANTLAEHVNQGASTIAYCGHGNFAGFVTTGYNNNNVNASTNGERLPFIVSVACINGAFHHNNDCFAEAWLKKPNGGAVVTLMSTINQPWSPPQRGQDYFYDILIGGFDYDQHPSQNGLNTNEQRTHWGSIVINAFNLALQERSAFEDINTFKSWTTFGDPSLQLRTKKPDIITLSNRNILIGAPFTTMVTQNNTPVANALVCISQNNVYLHAYTDANGNVTIPHEFVTGDVLLVVTAFNTTTVYDTISCIPNESPCLIFASRTPDRVTHNTQQYLSLTLKNIGAVPTTDSTTVTLTCDDPDLTIDHATGRLVPMTANGGTATIRNIFMVTPSENIATGRIFTINYTATCGDDNWTGFFSLTGIGNDCNPPTGLNAVADNNNNVTLTWDEYTPLEHITITDDVEAHAAFAINSPGPVQWTYIDGDRRNTGTFTELQYINEGMPMAYIVLDMEAAAGDSLIEAHSGNKFFGSPRCTRTYYNIYPNDDWIISPQLNFIGPSTFSFYARSYSAEYSNERFDVVYSTTGNNIIDFTYLTHTTVSTTTRWTQYTYNVPAGARYVAIHCVSEHQYIFCVDDISISGEIYNGRIYNIYRNGELIAENIIGNTYTDTGLEEGNYCYTITAGCDNDFESAESPVSCVTIDTPVSQDCDIPTGLTASYTSEQIILNWEQMPSAISYRIYRDNQVIATTVNNYYADPDVQADCTYAYSVQSICMNGESELSPIVYGITGINRYVMNDIKVYPNPTDGKIFVEGANIEKIDIMDMSGRTIRTTKISPAAPGRRIEMDISAYASGFYLMRITDNHKTMIMKVSRL